MNYKSDIVYIAFGSNLRLLPYRNIIKLLNTIKNRLPKVGLRVINSSGYWETHPVPFSNIPLFINSVVMCLIINKKINDPKLLLRKIKILEVNIGRKNKKNCISRSVDIDILDFKGKIINDNDIILPHPRLHLRKFVLNPMKNITKNWYEHWRG